MIKTKSRQGPNPYGAGGFTLAFGEFQKINRVIVKCSNDAVLAANDTAYALVATIGATEATQNIVTIQVFAASTVGAGPNAWADLAAGNMAALTFTVIADGE